MKKTQSSKKGKGLRAPNFFAELWGKSWTLVKSVVDVVREPVLILDKDLRVIAANETFYSTFKVKPKETQGSLVFKLGNGQWNIPALRKLLSKVLKSNDFFKGFQVAHDFPSIGRRIIILNARQIRIEGDQKDTGPIIVLAMEDVTEMLQVAEELAAHSRKIEADFMARIGKLEKKIRGFQKR